MAKKLSGIAAAKASAISTELAQHSIEQAKTAFKMSAALAIERVRLLTPESDHHDIKRLTAYMLALAAELKDPIAALDQVAEKGRIDLSFSSGEPRPKPTLRSACRVVLEEIQCARSEIRQGIEEDALAAKTETVLPKIM